MHGEKLKLGAYHEFLKLTGLAWSLLFLTAWPIAVNAKCLSVTAETGEFFEISKPANYCLDRDLVWTGEPFAWMNGGETSAGSAMGDIGASHSTLDLQGHSITAKRLGVSGLNDAARRLTKERYAVGIVVRNGKLRSETADGLVFRGLYGTLFFSLRSEVERFCTGKGTPPDCIEDWIENELAPAKRMRQSFPRTEHRIEAMSITAARVAVAIKGSSNNILNSQLKADGCAVNIYLIGTNQVIEGNTIVVSGKRCSPADAPIKLHAADNSIIRNNTIIIEGWGDKPEAAISLIDSKNVVIENNKIIGTKTLYKLWDEEPEQKSSVIERGNEFVSGLGRLFGK